ncbi:hypothetical protein AeMF1_014766 [Aphanomyces euteiches]|nr:hypothetical protein AeMF1_014766 [Aphanomyces euteiches]
MQIHAQSGSTEEFRESGVLLQGIVSQIDDWNERMSEEKSLKDIKSSALLKSGEVMKRLSMDELMDDDTNVDADDDYNDEKSTTMDGSSNLVRDLKWEGKMKRWSKISKSERIGEISDSIVKALSVTDDEQRQKQDFEMQKMEFKRDQARLEREYQREEAARQTQFEAEEAPRRREHELRMEDRRMQADREREKMMQEFVLKILSHQR